jgi:hypothetical protein
MVFLITMMMEAVWTSEMLVHFHESTRSYISDTYHLHTCYHENLISHKVLWSSFQKNHNSNFPIFISE